MKTSNVMIMICSMVIAPTDTLCMGSSLGSHISYEEYMANFSKTFDYLAIELAEINKEQMVNRNAEQGALRERNDSLEKIAQMQAYMTHLRIPVSEKKWDAIRFEDTPELREILAIFDHINCHLSMANTLLKKDTMYAANEVMRSLSEVHRDLVSLFGICNNKSYVSSQDNAIIKALLAEARSLSLSKVSAFVQSLDQPSAALRSENAASLSLSSLIHRKVEQYKQVYESRATAASELTQKDPQHIVSLLVDLSHRLCGTQLCKRTQENLKLIDKLCEQCSKFKKIFEEMKTDNSLSAKKLAQLLKAAMPRVVSAGSIIKTVEGLAVTASQTRSDPGVSSHLKQMASQVVVAGMKQGGLINDKELNALKNNAINGTPFSQDIQHITDIIKEFHLDWLMRTIIPILEHYDETLTIVMRRVADLCINVEPDCAEIRKIVYDLQGGNSALNRECNKHLLAYLKSLQHSWENGKVRPPSPNVVNEAWETLSNGSIYEDAWESLSERSFGSGHADERDTEASEVVSWDDIEIKYSSGTADGGGAGGQGDSQNESDAKPQKEDDGDETVELSCEYDGDFMKELGMIAKVLMQDPVMGNGKS